MGYYPRWRPLFHRQLHVPANDVFQDLPGPWFLLTCVMSGRFQEFLDRLLLEWRAARQAGENVFLAWRARKTLCTTRRKIVGIFTIQRRISTSSRFFSLFALGRKVVADSPPLAYARNRKWTDSPFLRSLCSTTALFVWRSQDENRVLDLVFARKRTDWQLNSRSWADRCVQETTKKKRNYRIRRGGGGGWGCGCVRVCQVNATRITRKVFEILNFVFGNLSFVFRSPYSTVCSHMEPSAKLGSPNWTLGRKLSRQFDHRGLWSGRQIYFLVANGD